MNKISRKPVEYYSDFAVFLERITGKYGERRAVSWFTRRQEEMVKTFRELNEEVLQLRECFCSRGFAGKHVAVVGENCYDWLLVYLAAAASGGVAVCIDPEQSEENIQQMVVRGDSAAVFVTASCRDICEPLLEKGTAVEDLFLLNGKAGTGRHTVEQLCAEGRELMEKNGGKTAYDIPIDTKQTAAIVYTSGTTSLSKPVMLSHQAILTNACESNYYAAAGPKSFSSLPFCHTYGMTCAVLASWARGAELIFNGSLKTAMRDLHLSCAYSLLTVPLMVEAIHNQIWLTAEKEGKAGQLRKLMKFMRFKKRLGLKKPHRILEDIRKKSVGTIQVIICGGAHMSQEIAEEFNLMGLCMLQGYGITECSPLVSVNCNDWCKLESVGLVLPSCEVKFENKEILVRGKTVMNGYYGMPEETEEVMDGEWFRTGDLGEMDRDGFLYITGRKKNLVVFKNGKKISPESLEEKIRRIPLVKDVLVYGAVSGVSADDVKLAASIYPDPERAGMMSSYEILEELQREINKINDALPLYQQIQMVNIREQEFDKTAMQKIKRYTV